MAEVRTDKVCGREKDGEGPLSDDDDSAEKRSRLFQLQKRHQVHPLVFSLFLKIIESFFELRTCFHDRTVALFSCVGTYYSQICGEQRPPVNNDRPTNALRTKIRTNYLFDKTTFWGPGLVVVHRFDCMYRT